MNVPFVVPFYGAIFALIYIGLTIRVIMLRTSPSATAVIPCWSGRSASMPISSNTCRWR
jgi:hypothetical protein